MSSRQTPDLLALAEDVASRRMPRAAAVAELRAAGGRDVDARIAELDGLVTAIEAVGRLAAPQAGASVGARAAVDSAGSVAGAQATHPGMDLRRPVAVPVPGPTVRATRRIGSSISGIAALVGAVLIGAVLAGVVMLGAARVPVAATPQPSSTPVTADPAIPPILDERLGDAPRAAFWSLVSSDRVAVWTWASGEALVKLAEVSAWADPAGTPPGGLGSVQRTLLVSPDGRRFAFAETTGSGVLRGRLRVFDAAGRLVWELGGTGADGVGSLAALAFAWSPDGRSLAVESGSWDIVSFDEAGAAVSHHLDATTPLENAYGLIGFSADGGHLYGWQTGGEAEWWQRPVAVDVSTGALTTLAGFPADALAGVGASNATFPLERIAGGDGAALAQPLLAKGDAAWAAVREGTSVPVATSSRPQDSDPRWGPPGRAVVVTPRASGDASEVPAGIVSVVAPGATGTIREAFTFAPGAYDIAPGGVSGDFALCLAAAPHGAVGGSALGYDEAVLVRTSDGATSVVVAPGRSADGAGVMFAGWVAGT
jgi:hypothetical protein